MMESCLPVDGAVIGEAGKGAGKKGQGIAFFRIPHKDLIETASFPHGGTFDG
jgi:hypothetical protein